MRGLLLDTHILIWWLDDDGRLPGWARAPLSDPETPCFVSAATLWEIGIKRALGKWRPRRSLPRRSVMRAFSVSPSALTTPSARPSSPHHRDPFDRMLAAQAQLEGLTIATVDPRLRRYDVALFPLDSRSPRSARGTSSRMADPSPPTWA